VHFKLCEYEVGGDEDDNPVYSCILSEACVGKKIAPLKRQAKQTYQILSTLVTDKGIEHIPKAGMKTQKTVQLNDFKDQFFKAGISDTDKTDSISKAFNRQIQQLKKKGYIAEWDGYVWITDKPDK